MGLIADSTRPPCSGSLLAHNDAWMHPRRMNPPFLTPSSPLDLPQPAPLPPYFVSVLSVSPLKNTLSSLPSPLPVPHLIHRARFLSLLCESCEGNLEGLSGINLKGKRLSLLLSLALSADWVRSPGTWRLLISGTLPHLPHLCSKFLLSALTKKNSVPLSEKCGPHPLFSAPVRDWVKDFVNPLGGTNNLWRDWLLFEDVRVIHLFRWRYTEEDLWSSGSLLEQLVRSCLELWCIIHTVWGMAVSVTKRRPVRGGAHKRSHAELCWGCSVLCMTWRNRDPVDHNNQPRNVGSRVFFIILCTVKRILPFY